MNKIYVVKTYCDDEFYDQEIIDICESKDEAKEQYGREGLQRSGTHWINFYNQEEFEDEFNERQRAEMLEEYGG